MSGIVGSLNTRGSGLINLGSASDGQLFTGTGAGLPVGFEAAAGGGKLLQVVSTTKTDATSATVTTFTDIAGMSVAITPAATSSKILVTVWIQASSAANNQGGYYKLVRGSTDINIGDAAGSRLRAWGNMFPSVSDNGASFTGTSFLDSPSSTSEETYKVQWTAGPSNNGNNINKPRATVDSNRYVRMTSGIMVQEIGA
jgi:hypothetical protein